MREGKIAAILAANVTGIGTPDNSNFVFLYYSTDDTSLRVKNSAGVVVKVALAP